MALRRHLSGGACRTFIADMKVEAAHGQAYFYPDVVVTCSEAVQWRRASRSGRASVSR